MGQYRNTTEQRRVWPTIQRPDGTTLDLEPGETAELELPENFSDATLEDVAPPKKLTKKEQEAQDKAVAAEAAAEQEAAAAAAAAETTTEQGEQS